MHLDANGTKQWTKIVGGSSTDFFAQMVPTSDGGIAIAGETFSRDGDLLGNHGSNDAFIMKVKTP